MRIIAYTFEADVHCPSSTLAQISPGHIHLANEQGIALDEHSIPERIIDREGNPVRPVFNIDEHGFTHCGDCHKALT